MLRKSLGADGAIAYQQVARPELWRPWIDWHCSSGSRSEGRFEPRVKIFVPKGLHSSLPSDRRRRLGEFLDELIE
jgi:hypothetical protein